MFEAFKNEIRQDIDEFVSTRKMHRAIDLSVRTNQHFNHNEYPLYFTGNLDAKLVLIHLNPKQANNHSEQYKGNLWLDSFDDYFEYHQHFGKYKYGAGSTRQHKSRFDRKQIRFLKPFGVINFVEERSEEDKFINLERVVDDKLQLELIPYGSDNFDLQGFNATTLQPHFARLIDVVTACPRKYVIFCGRIFDSLVRSTIRTFKFNLTRKDGLASKGQYSFSVLMLPFNRQQIKAGLAHSFANKSLAGEIMEAYGRECKRIYDNY